MVATLTFLGATGTVTGSKFLLESEGRRTLVDCGPYQGERTWRRLNWEPLPVRSESISDVVLTHAHLDHSGYLPVRGGVTGPTWCTEGTAALAAIILRDSAPFRTRTPRMHDSEGSPGTTRHARCTTPLAPKEPLRRSNRWTTTSAVT